VLALFHDLHIVLSREESPERGETTDRPFRLVRGRLPDVVFLQEADGRSLRYDAKAQAVAALGSAIAVVVGFVAKGLRGRVLAQAVGQQLGRPNADATTLLLDLERRLDLPVT
jgi:endonuclease/exonuclease/phosphatase family metal-dependent hydrolase